MSWGHRGTLMSLGHRDRGVSKHHWRRKWNFDCDCYSLPNKLWEELAHLFMANRKFKRKSDNQYQGPTRTKQFLHHLTLSRLARLTCAHMWPTTLVILNRVLWWSKPNRPRGVPLCWISTTFGTRITIGPNLLMVRWPLLSMVYLLTRYGVTLIRCHLELSKILEYCYVTHNTLGLILVMLRKTYVRAQWLLIGRTL